jgi:GAF domain-containing protein
MAFPLKVHKRCRGVLVFGDRESRVISDEIRAFARMAADYLALFLENLYLKSRLTQLAPFGSSGQGPLSDTDNLDSPT